MRHGQTRLSDAPRGWWSRVATTTLLVVLAFGASLLPADQQVVLAVDIGTNSCQGVDACVGAAGPIGDNSCNGDFACAAADPPIGDNSCNGGTACYFAAFTAIIGDGSCNGDGACDSIGIAVGNGSCNGVNACVQTGYDESIGEGSCNGDHACIFAVGPVGASSCNGGNACWALSSDAGDDSCNGVGACDSAGAPIGDESCNGENACDFTGGSIGDGSCNEVRACHQAPAMVGNYSCNGFEICFEREENVGDCESNTFVPAECSPPTPLITALSDVHAWVGLKNSDDQGTRFDVYAELIRNDEVVATGLARCIAGVTRNPGLAKEVVVAWGPFTPISALAGDEFELRLSTRVGTTAGGARCGGHASAVGLRLYYDAAGRPSGWDWTIGDDPSVDLYLHSDGSACANRSSSGVTMRNVNVTSPADSSAKCADSTAIKFAGGNHFREIGSWSYVLP